MTDQSLAEFEPCNLCGHDRRTRRFLTAGEVTYSRCQNCRLIVQDPLPSHRELKEIYRSYFRERRLSRGLAFGYTDYDRERSTEQFRARYLSWFRPYLEPGRGRFLDFGCGTGNLVQALAAEGVDAYGYEFSEEAISILRARQIPFFLYEDLKRTSTRFTHVSMLDVVEHLRDPAGDIERISNLMEPDGVLFVETINADDWLARHVYKGHWQGISPVHLYLFGESTLRRLLGAHGFDVVQLRTYRMGGSLLKRLALKAAAYGVAGAWPIIARREHFLGHSTARLHRFADTERRAAIQITLGDGLRVVARRRPRTLRPGQGGPL